MTKVKQYRKKPVIVDAVVYDGTNKDEIIWFTINKAYSKDEKSSKLIIPTLEGDMEVSVGDYVIQGVNGEFYPCKPNIFLKTYEEI